MSASDERSGGDEGRDVQPPGESAPEEFAERLAEALAGETDLDEVELAEAREQAGLSLESFEEMAEITEALEFRGVSREADALPDPDWVKDIVQRTAPLGKPEAGPDPAAKDPAREAPRLWLVPLTLAAAALLFWMIRPVDSGGSRGQGGFEGDPGAMLGTGQSGEESQRALLSSEARSLVLPIRLDAGDEVRASVREASNDSAWEPIKLRSSEVEISIPEQEWSRLDPKGEYAVDLTIYRLSSGMEERLELPLRWQP